MIKKKTVTATPSTPVLPSLVMIYKREPNENCPLAFCPATLIGRTTIDRKFARSLALDQHEPIILAVIPGLKEPFVISGSNRILHLRWWDQQDIKVMSDWFERPATGTIRAIVCQDLTLTDAMAMRSEVNNLRSPNLLADFDQLVDLQKAAARGHVLFSEAEACATIGISRATLTRLMRLAHADPTLMKGAREGRITISALYSSLNLNGRTVDAVTHFTATGHLTQKDIDGYRRVAIADSAAPILTGLEMPAVTASAGTDRPLFVALDAAGEVLAWGRVLADVEKAGTPFRVELIPV